MTDKERYDKVCFSLDQKLKELENLRTDIFILSPEISILVAEIGELYNTKKELEEKLND
jgi:hypothetical protein